MSAAFHPELEKLWRALDSGVLDAPHRARAHADVGARRGLYLALADALEEASDPHSDALRRLLGLSPRPRWPYRRHDHEAGDPEGPVSWLSSLATCSVSSFLVDDLLPWWVARRLRGESLLKDLGTTRVWYYPAVSLALRALLDVFLTPDPLLPEEFVGTFPMPDGLWELPGSDLARTLPDDSHCVWDGRAVWGVSEAWPELPPLYQPCVLTVRNQPTRAGLVAARFVRGSHW